MSEVPEGLHYTEEHEYVRAADGDDEFYVGITDYAQSELGDVVFVELPAAGDSFDEDGRVRDDRGRQGRVRAVLPDGRRGPRDQRVPGRRPGAREQRPVRRRLDDPPPGLRSVGGGRASCRPKTTAPTSTNDPHRRSPMSFVPHSDADRREMLARIGVRTSGSSTPDVPASLVLHEPLDVPGRAVGMGGDAPGPRARRAAIRPSSASPAAGCTTTTSRPPSTTSSGAASSTRPTRRTSPRSPRARCR